MQADVSVVIPTWNRRTVLARTVNSALAQRGVNVEVIVVDDGSADDTATAMGALADRGVRLIRHEQSVGVADARNAGLAVATAPWVAFLDDDDLWSPDKLRCQLDVAGTARPDGSTPQWVCSDAVLIDQFDMLIGWAPAGGEEISLRDLLHVNTVPGGGSGVLVRRDLLDRAGGFDGRYFASDWDMWIRFGLEGGAVAVARQPLLAYRVWRTSADEARRKNTKTGHISSQFERLGPAWQEVMATHGPAARQLGASDDLTPMHRYVAYRAMYGRSFGLAAQSYREVARINHSRRAALLVQVVGVAGPALLPLWAWRNRRLVPAAVRQEAERWLGELGNSPSPVASINQQTAVSQPAAMAADH
ncbi:MAG: glycosyltransferase family 2 protein [Acidimicrobiales bacterium]